MNSSMPLVSILIPVYNRESIISETLECAINQTYKNIEIIISDNCSTDNTWSILEEYSKKDNRIKIFKNETNIGPVLNWKKCIDNVKGEFTKILWSDDLISIDFIEKTILCFDEETAFVITGFQIFNSESNQIHWQSKFQNKTLYKSDFYLKDILIYNESNFPVSPGCALFRTIDIKSAFIDEIPNIFNLDFRKYGAGNDLLFFLITANNYKSIKCLNEISSFFRSHSSSITINNNLSLFYEYSKFFFIENFNKNFYVSYRNKILLSSLKNQEYKILLKTLKVKTSYLSLMSQFLKLLNYKLKIAFSLI